MKLVIVAASLLVLGGCAVTGGVTPAATTKSAFSDAVYTGEAKIINEQAITGEEYRIYKQGAHGGTSPLSIRDEIEGTASDFCKGKKKEVRLLRQTASTPPYLLGNFPKVELVFECIEPGQVQLGTTSTPAQSAHASTTNNATSDKYSDLAKLKKLLDDGVITQQEFQREKDKILGR